MKFLTRTFNFATPFGGAVSLFILVAIGALALFALNGAGFRFDPLNLAERRAVSAEVTAAAAVSDAAARRLEAAGATDTVQRIDRITVQIRAADAVVYQSALAAQDAPDAKSPVDPFRLARLQLADRQLCDLRPSICPDRPAPADDAGTGPSPMRTPPPA